VNYREATERIAALPATRILRQSSLYETEPIGGNAGSGPFINGVIEIDTGLDAMALLRRLLAIERAMGRKRVRGRKLHARGPYRPRIIDLDILFFNREIIDSRALQVPHPRLHERRFVLVPISELAPALIHPQLNSSISELLALFKASQRVTLMRADQLRPVSSKRPGARR
jgi:2-amino-4-hydroxy-6-hydroxymethyldihydropteridine diphosphokinase